MVSTQVCVAIEADVGATNTDEFARVQRDAGNPRNRLAPDAHAVDIQSYVKWREAIAAGP